MCWMPSLPIVFVLLVLMSSMHSTTTNVAELYPYDTMKGLAAYFVSVFIHRAYQHDKLKQGGDFEPFEIANALNELECGDLDQYWVHPGLLGHGLNEISQWWKSFGELEHGTDKLRLHSVIDPIGTLPQIRAFKIKIPKPTFLERGHSATSTRQPWRPRKGNSLTEITREVFAKMNMEWPKDVVDAEEFVQRFLKCKRSNMIFH